MLAKLSIEKCRPTKANATIQTMKPHLSPELAADRITAWYGRLEPRLGIYLTDPNVVLTLADARAQTETYVADMQPSDIPALTELSKQTELEGIRFQTEIYDSRTTGRPALMVNIESLAGCQNVSQATHLPGIPRFDAATGWTGADAWKQAALAGIQAAADRGAYPPQIHENHNVRHVLSGVMRAYPDVAVLAMITDHPLADHEAPYMRHTHVPYSDFYDCAQPNYMYDQKDEALVREHVVEWGKLLKAYYTSPAHQRLAAEPTFRACRGPAHTPAHTAK